MGAGKPYGQLEGGGSAPQTGLACEARRKQQGCRGWGGGQGCMVRVRYDCYSFILSGSEPSEDSSSCVAGAALHVAGAALRVPGLLWLL